MIAEVPARGSARRAPDRACRASRCSRESPTAASSARARRRRAADAARDRTRSSAAARASRSSAIALNVRASELTSSPPFRPRARRCGPSPSARAACSSARSRLCAGRKIAQRRHAAPTPSSPSANQASVGPSSRSATNTGGGSDGTRTMPTCAVDRDRRVLGRRGPPRTAVRRAIAGPRLGTIGGLAAPGRWRRRLGLRGRARRPASAVAAACRRPGSPPRPDRRTPAAAASRHDARRNLAAGRRTGSRRTGRRSGRRGTAGRCAPNLLRR